MDALGGIRVADFTRVVAGPYCTMLLGDLGANVIKVEEPGRGDDSRGWGPPFVNGESTYFLSVNRNKRSVCLDLRSDEGHALARTLIAQSDIVVENFRVGFMAQLGLDYESLRAAHPRLIYCSISGYGQTGPASQRAGYDVIVAAQGGMMGITGTPDGAPVKTGVAQLDVATGLYAYSSIMAALYHRERTGVGQHIAVSLLGTQVATLINAASMYLVAGEVLTPQGSAHASIVPYQAFAASDGYIVIGGANDKLFAQLADLLGHPEWPRDPRFATNADRVAHRATLIPLIEAIIRGDTVAAWEARLATTGIAYAPVNRMDAVFRDPQVVASGQVVTVDHPTVGPLPLVGPAALLSVTPAVVRLPPPTLGQHTDAVVRALRLGQFPDLPTAPPHDAEPHR
jgi:crotonobetainyl-CoA:carnitine CoA-transferase CaiB-like acyl-CoA transferase